MNQGPLSINIIRDGNNIMIKIKNDDNTLLIRCPVSEFVFGITYCEHTIPFYMKGIKIRHEESEIRKNIGIEGHKKEEKIETEKIEKGEIRLTEDMELQWLLSDPNSDIEFIRERLFTRLSYQTHLDEKNIKLILTGRADKVLRKEECLIIQEDKFPQNPYGYINRDKPFDSQILQATVYLNSIFAKKNFNWFEIPHKNKKWIINIIDSNENNIIKSFEGILEDQDKLYLEGNISRFISIVIGDKEKMHHDNLKKCTPCEYANICTYSMT